MFTFNDADILAKLDLLVTQHIPAQADRGLSKHAAIVEGQMQSTTAHGDITGATRASYRAILIGGPHTGSAEATSGLNAAISAIASSLTDHGGRPASQDSGVVLGPEDRGVMHTAYTDYQDKLETENAGQKAVLAPTLQANATAYTQSIAGEPL